MCHFGLPHGTTNSPDLSGWSGLQDQIGAGEKRFRSFSITPATPKTGPTAPAQWSAEKKAYHVVVSRFSVRL
jgi:hypothetical protein